MTGTENAIASNTVRGSDSTSEAQTVLVQAFGLELAAHPNTLLAFVGARTDWFTMHLRKYIRGAGLSSRVHVESVTSDVYWWFRAADAFVCASDVESLPRTVLEAMAFSVPVIATRIFGLPELIEDGVTGYLCEARDLKALADALERFLNTSPSERAGVAAAAARRVREKHDSRGYALAYDRLLRRLVEDPAVLPDEALTSAAPASLRTS